MHNVEGDSTTAGETPTFDAGPRSFISRYSLGMRAVEYRPGHWRTGNGGVFSWNLHEVGQFIADDGSNTGQWIFKFNCESFVPNEDGSDSGLYCRKN